MKCREAAIDGSSSTAKIFKAAPINAAAGYLSSNAGLNLGNFASAVRRSSEKHGIDKSAPQQDSNDEVNNRDFDRTKNPVAHLPG